MRDWQTLSHAKWICKYHLLFVTKYRHQTIYGKLRRKIEGIIRDLCRQKGLGLLEDNAMKGHVHLKPITSPAISRKSLGSKGM
ncbi:MAG: IS200/IS605 family transposase [Desulfobacula sp.]|nr:IS200/IS605 family transposase [Desulfobacula sp.]